MFEKVTVEQLQKERPDLMESIRGNLNTELKEAQDRAAKAEQKLKLNGQKEKSIALLKESKLPEVAQHRIGAKLAETVFESDEKLKEAVETAVKMEREYINTLSEKGKININGAGEQITISESVRNQLSAQLGQKEEIKK